MSRRWVAALLMTTLPTLAFAVPTTFNYGGTCAFGCGSIGLSFGDPVSGYITAASGFDADNVLWASEVIDYGFTFGTLSVSPLTHAVQGGIGLGGFVIADDLRFASYDDIFGVSINEANTGSLLGLSGWLSRVGFKLAGGPGEYVAAAVPEPGTFVLLGCGVLALAMMRRRMGR